MEEFIINLIKNVFRAIFSLFDAGIVAQTLAENKLVVALTPVLSFFVLGYLWIILFGISDFPGLTNKNDALKLMAGLALLSLALLMLSLLYEKNRKRKGKKE